LLDGFLARWHEPSSTINEHRRVELIIQKLLKIQIEIHSSIINNSNKLILDHISIDQFCLSFIHVFNPFKVLLLFKRVIQLNSVSAKYYHHVYFAFLNRYLFPGYVSSGWAKLLIVRL